MTRPGFWLPFLGLCLACSDDGGSGSSESGFTTGEETTTSMTTLPSTSMTTTLPSTSETASTTVTSSSTGDPTTDTESSTSDGTTLIPETTSTTTGPEVTTTGGTTTGDATSTGPGTSTGSVGECGDTVVDDDQVCFSAAADTAAGTEPIGVASGDFDGGGAMDVVVLNSNDAVGVLLGDGTGGLGAATPTALTGTVQVRIAAAELSGDAFTDIVTVNTGANDVSVLINDGVGGFTETQYATGPGGTDLDILAIDGVAGLDMVVANGGDGTYTSLINDGAGAFTVVDTYSVGAVTNIVGIAVGSINGNPPDVFFCAGPGYGASPGGPLDGTFMDGTVITGAAGSALGIANGGDLNADADLDVVVVDQTDELVYVLLGGIMADFDAAALDAGVDPVEAVIADVTGEGTPDVVAASAADDTVSVFAGDGLGLFALPVVFNVGSGPTGVTVTDLNGDGVGDIIVSNNTDATVSVLLSDP